MSEQTNQMTLTYLTNPLYQSGIVKAEELNDIDRNEKRFYKKRILALTKDMLRGEYPSDALKKIHNNYIFEIISHFKMTDKYDIIQDDYSDNICDIKELDSPSSNTMIINEANKNIGIRIDKRNTLDSFVSVKKINTPAKNMIPMKREYDLRNPELKTKGIKKKKTKNSKNMKCVTDNISIYQKEKSG